MAHYYLPNMAVNIPKIINPALESIKSLILSSNQLCQSLLYRPENEFKFKLQQMISQSSTIINSVLQDTRKTEQNSQDLEVVNDYKPIPVKEALFKVMEINKKIMVKMFEEFIKGRVLIYYLKQFPITSPYTNKRIVDIQAQQVILMKNTLP
jgi:hypothetical protein